MTTKISNNLLDLAIVMLHLFFVIANMYDPNPVYEFLADWDLYMTYITWCFEVMELQEQFRSEWWH